MTAFTIPEHVDPETLSTLFERYETLCQYCDGFFEKVAQDASEQMQCAKGCSSCCILETVTPLEAYIISAYLKQHPYEAQSESPQQCVFLEQDICRIYPVRPMICRTHGLPMWYPDRQAYDVCPRNFPEKDLSTLPEEYILDVERITDNLMRLNLAFCLLTQTADAAEKRISLAEIVHTPDPL